ncbi:hybrid sensor histidine kinase/response regulator [Opitutus terrae]|uniref:histidine kinase n=1 Tax=Opitutus terrae (strain DSM 11246 / JCM 15787 / PB90-1) TaxID=452637 RepID=B1ZVU5_OPITP|nr:ATP-binding protein [Opitutus terrae]ACB75031.1 histidine kinase [Opitutus terrae PB90-1]
MFSNSSRTFSGRKRWLVAGAALALFMIVPAELAGEGASPQPGPNVVAGKRVLTSFEQIWQLPEAEQRAWHPVKLNYVVYYYDPLWMALWGRAGESDSYLSLGAKVFPIKAGQRILVEGAMQPSRGMRVEDPKVTVLDEAVPLVPLGTAGEVASTERFNKRLVVIEGLVDRQVARDANHLEMYLIAEGRVVLAQLLLNNEVPTPQLKGTVVRATGVYFARSEPDWPGPKIELWVQRPEDVVAVSTLERDPRFAAPLRALADLGGAAARQDVHVAGVVVAQDPGKTITIREGAHSLVLHTPQTLTFRSGEEVEAIGWPEREGDSWVLRRATVRGVRTTCTTVSQLWALPDAEKTKWHPVRIDLLVYYFDPDWKALWGQVGDSDEFLSLGSKDFALKPGQRIRIEGLVRPADGIVVEEPRVTVLQESVPLVALETQGRIGDTDQLNKHWVVLEGYVDRQQVRGVGHVDLDLIVEGRLVVCRLLLPAGKETPTWEGAMVRASGVYSATQDPAGSVPSLELWTPGPDHLKVIGHIDSDARFDRPATPIDRLAQVDQSTMVRIVGVARTQQPGKLVTVRDETGQLNVATLQSRSLRLGEQVEAIGYPRLEGEQMSLRDGLVRPSRAAPAPPVAGLPQLRLADQLRELQPEEAGRGYPVHLSGVVTWARPNAEFFYVRDVSGGVCVFRPPDSHVSMFAGTKVEVFGVSATGRFTPVVLASIVQTSASIELPEAPQVTLEQALTGVEEAQWVSMRGYVRAVTPEAPWVRLEMTASGGEFHALMPPHDLTAKLVGAVVRVRGVCSAITNDKRQLTGIRVWVPSYRYVDIEDAAPSDPFAFPERSIASLRQFNSLEALNRRVRVSGTVSHQSPGRLIYLQDETEGLLALSRDQTRLEPGDHVEVVGFPGRENRRVVLREAVFRRTGPGTEPVPVPWRARAMFHEELDGRLVRVEAQLLDVGSSSNGVRLLNQRDQVLFEAVLESQREVPSAWVPRSRVALTGVYQIQFDEYRRPQAVRLLLRRPGDVTILERPSWLTVRRVLAVTGVLVIVVLLGFARVMALRRRVRHQTGIIKEQEESERAARLEAALARASKLESLGVLAGGIAHDFNNLLTVIMGNLSLAKIDPKIEPDTVRCLSESERAAARARDLTQQLLTFAKGGEPMRMPTRLPDLVREAAQFALHGAKVRCDYQIASDLWPASVDRGQIAQVVHNIVINANQAMPTGGRIEIGLQNEMVLEPRSGLEPGRYVRMTVADSGAGIPAETLGRIFEPYYSTKPQGTGLGLATVYSIVRRHEGHIEVRSIVGEGTTFTTWLPAATVPMAAKAPEESTRPRASRVLLMDDDAAIRLLGTTILKKAGYDVTAVSDGAAAVSEYAAAAAAGRSYDLVVLDLTVPGAMGGVEAMAKLKEMNPQVRAIVSSGYSSDPIMANYQAHGFRARVPKPYLASDLISAVRAVLEAPAG